MVLAVVVAAVAVVSYAHRTKAPTAPTKTAATTSRPSNPACSPPGHPATDAPVADPTAPHGLYVLSGSKPLSQAMYGRQIQRYLVHNPDVCGGAVFVFWNQVADGPSARSPYDWSYVNQLIAPWARAHKTVALLLGGAEGYSDDGQVEGVPSWLLPTLNVVSCSNAAAPVYWQSAYASRYQSFVAAFIHHYEANPHVAYIHVGIATGEQTLVLGVKDDPSCLAKWDAAGYQSEWPSFVSQMIAFVTSLHASVQLTASINGYADFPTSAQIAAPAASGEIGIGFNGLQANDVAAVAAGEPCTANWCAVFRQYAGQIPLYLQTLHESYPGPGVAGGYNRTGPLPPLLGTGLALHTQIFELYAQDWLLAFDPSYQGYARYHVETARALAAAAAIVGTANGVAPKGP
ncbi:MAG: hypothetical protein ACLPVF_07625 [Acidimicrobiales bacterium]